MQHHDHHDHHHRHKHHHHHRLIAFKEAVCIMYSNLGRTITPLGKQTNKQTNKNKQKITSV